MKNRTLILHNQIVWGPSADEDGPVRPKQQEGSRRRSSHRDTGRRLPTEHSRKLGQVTMTAMIQTKESLMLTPQVKGMSHKILLRKRMKRRPPVRMVRNLRNLALKRNLRTG